MFKFIQINFFLFLIFAFFNLNIFAAQRELLLVPQPQSVKIQGGYFKFNAPRTVIRINAQAEQDDQFSAELLREEIETDLGIRIPVGTESNQQTIHLAIYAQDQEIQRLCKNRRMVPDETLGREGYVLSVRDREIILTALTSTGLFYGVQTLRQLIRGNAQSDRIPAVMIRDYPQFAFRGVQDDISRGPVPTISFLKSEIRRLAELKINYLTLYTEHVFQIRSHPQFAPPGGALTVEDIQELTAYAQKFRIELIGNFQAFGHFYHILKHPQFEHLGENEWIISPALKESYKFLEDILDEIAPAYSSRYFQVNCDETWGLGEGPGQKLVAQKGVAGVYADHLNWLHQQLTKHEKQMLMWGDIALEHPEILDQLPKDILMLTWDYSARESFINSIQPFRNSGFEVIVCPGVSCWNRIFPDFHTARINIRNFVRDGAKAGALGMLNTSWDDDGENLFTYNWYGLAYGADQAWNPGATDDTGFNRRYSASVYGDRQNFISQAVEKTSELHQLAGDGSLTNSLFWKNVLPEWGQTTRIKISEWHPIPGYTASIDSMLKLARPGHYASDLAYLHFANDRLRFFYQFRYNLIQASQWYREACLAQADRELTDGLLRKSWSALVKNLQELQNLRETYRQLWLAENRIYWLDRNLKKYDALLSESGEIVSQLERAMTLYEQNLPLPAPRDIRLSATELQGAFLTNWLISGPYPNEDQEGLKKDFLKEIGGETAAFPKPTAPGALKKAGVMNWHLAKSSNPMLKFTAYFDEITNKMAYAFATIHSPRALEVEFSVGSDDGIKIFLNGKVVHEHAIARSHEPDADQVKVRLNQGVNRLLVKVDQGVGDWGFSVRLVGAKVRAENEANYVIEGE